jgi:epoxide hydrolase 4
VSRSRRSACRSRQIWNSKSWIRGGKGQPVLLLHGFPDSLKMWNGVAEHLLAAGHRVIAYDQRGFGLSTAPAKLHRYALHRIVQDAVDVLSKLGVTLARSR